MLHVIIPVKNTIKKKQEKVQLLNLNLLKHINTDKKKSYKKKIKKRTFKNIRKLAVFSNFCLIGTGT